MLSREAGAVARGMSGAGFKGGRVSPQLRALEASIVLPRSGRQIECMTHAISISRPRVTCLMICAISALMLVGASTPDSPSVEQAAIIQAVLNDASDRWQGPRPCLSDRLESFDGGRVTPQRISQLAYVKPPFKTCRSSSLSAMHGDRFLTISAPKIIGASAVVEFDYDCPTCGNGMLYTLRKLKGRWRVVGRQASWVS